MRKNLGAKAYTYPTAGIYPGSLRKGRNTECNERSLGRHQR